MSVGIFKNGKYNKVAGNAKDGTAANTTYNNGTSGLQANNVQSAISELDSTVDTLNSNFSESFCKTFTHSNKQWGDFGLKYIFANLYDIMWIVIFLFGIIVSIIALPTRKTIVKRTEKNKNVLTVVKISSRMILDAILLMILMIVLCFSI